MKLRSFLIFLNLEPAGFLNSSLMKIARNRKQFSVRAGKFNLHLGKRTFLMGIVNLTEDSFSQDGLLKGNTARSLAIKKAVHLARQMENQGADIIDIGAESTRPGSRPISISEEIARLIPTIKKITAQIGIPISVDTYKSEVAKEAIDAGASIINNVFGTKAQYNSKLAQICAKKNTALIIMHIRGMPLDMQKQTKYKSLISEIIKDLKAAITCALDAGLDSRNIIVDPGIGFAKTLNQNLEIINRLNEFESLKKPILIGLSRKSFIGKLLNLDVKNRIFGTAASVAFAIACGCHIVRVHDVGQMRQVACVSDAILNYK